MDGDSLEQNLKCPICFNIADDPYETSCCGHLFCNKCIKGIKKLNCPICRSNKVNFRENSFVKNLLTTLNVKCPYGCESFIALSDAKYHRFQCIVSLFKCTIIKNGIACNFEGPKVDSMKHFAESHSDQMIMLAENYSKLKNTFDKHSMFEKLNKLLKKDKSERDRNRLSIFKDDDEYNEFYFNEINLNGMLIIY